MSLADVHVGDPHVDAHNEERDVINTLLTAIASIPTTEQIQDIVAAEIVQGANLTAVYDDASGTVTLSSTGGGSTDPETVRDTIGLALTPGALIRVTVNDAGDTITLAAILPGLPTYAPTTLTKDYDARTCSYNFNQDTMAGFRISQGKAIAGTGYSNHLHLGDSVSAAYMGSDPSVSNDPAHSWVMVYRDMYLGSGVPWGGTGYVCPGQNFNPASSGDDQDPRWTLSSGWNSHQYGLHAIATAAGETATLEVPAQFSGGSHVSWIVDDAFADLTYVVKDSTGATIASGSNGALGTNAIRIKTVNGSDIRSITFTSPAGTSTSNKARIYPTNIYLDSGYMVHNFSAVGLLMTGANGIENTGNVYNGVDKIALLCVPTPDLLSMLGGGNDLFALTPIATIVSGIANVFAKWGANARSKLFIGHSQAASWTNTNMNTYTQNYWQMCETNNFAFIDSYGYSGGYTLMNAMGIMRDTSGGQTHPDQSFHQQLGRLVAYLLMAGPSLESLQDLVASMVVAGANMTKSYDDALAQLTLASSGGGGGGVGFTAAPAWVGSHAYTAGDFVRLPTGGIGYRNSSGTSSATFDATERDAWVFIAGGHYEKVTASGAFSWKAPLGIVKQKGRLKGSGGSGGGGGSSATATNQSGGGAGGAAAPQEFECDVTPGTTYSGSVAAARTGGAGGAAGGNAGTSGTSGDDTTYTVGAVTYTSKGGGSGTRSTANSTSAANGGLYGFPGGTQASGAFYPGAGGTSGAAPVGGIPLGDVVGGGGGASANGANGGQGGGARTAPGAAVAAGSGVTGTTSGAAGTTATEPGCGGGGGGGGTNGTGAGGPGGGSSAGIFETWF